MSSMALPGDKLENRELATVPALPWQIMILDAAQPHITFYRKSTSLVLTENIKRSDMFKVLRSTIIGATINLIT